MNMIELLRNGIITEEQEDLFCIAVRDEYNVVFVGSDSRILYDVKQAFIGLQSNSNKNYSYIFYTLTRDPIYGLDHLSRSYPITIGDNNNNTDRVCHYFTSEVVSVVKEMADIDLSYDIILAERYISSAESGQSLEDRLKLELPASKRPYLITRVKLDKNGSLKIITKLLNVK